MALHDAADMSRPEQITAMVERALAESGGRDIVVNNAGIQHVSRIEDFPVDRFDAIIALVEAQAPDQMRTRVSAESRS